MPRAFSSHPPDPRFCEQARLPRAARFHGLFFTAVRPARICCRPVRLAPIPKAHNVEYCANTASAAAAGARPRLRYRAETALPIRRKDDGNLPLSPALR